MKLNQKLCEDYFNNPMLYENQVREFAGVPDKKYFSVTAFPESVRGAVFVTLDREVKARKVSKSDQP